MSYQKGVFYLAIFLLGLIPGRGLLADTILVKVAVVTTFEVGNDTGDSPGEFQYWAEREKWPKKVSIPGVDHPILMDDKVTLGIVAGTTSRAQSQIMALVMSGRFDFTKTYWIFNGIAGVDPAKASIGSAAWARFVVDGNIGYEIDSREAAPSWPYAIVPLGSTAPNEKPNREGWEPEIMAYELNPGLVSWAYALTKNIEIPDTPAMASYRSRYKGYPNAQKPPFVLIGDSLGSDRFWYGPAMTKWANDWTRLWTEGRGDFAMTDMEDQGFAWAMRRLAKMGRVDFNRVLFLRTASDYCMPAPGEASTGLHGAYFGYTSSLEAAYRVGSAVAHTLSANWAAYQNTIPGP